jgi:hypothetical protein
MPRGWCFDPDLHASMHELGTLEEAKAGILENARRAVLAVRRLEHGSVESIEDAIAQLAALREQAHDGLNQIRRVQLIVRAVEWLLAHDQGNAATHWRWCPRRTADPGEPDLQGREGSQVALSAMVIASNVSEGSGEAQLRRALAKLSTMPGRRFLFVDTTALKRRAVTRVLLTSWDISVVQIVVPDAAAEFPARPATFPIRSAASAS